MGRLYKASQDGGDFYLYPENGKLEAVVSYPHNVGLSFNKAQEARQWFIGLMDHWGINIEWRNDHG